MSTAGPNLVPDDDPGPSPYHLAGAADRAMAVLDNISSVGFEAIVEIRGMLDIEALGLAWARLASRHPILTCVRREDRWLPRSPPPFGEEVGSPRHDQPPIALRVARIDDGWRLTMMCNHVAFDGTASKILLGDLRNEYVGVLDGRIEDSLDLAPRTLEALAPEPDWRTAAVAALRGTAAWWQTPVSTHVDPGSLPVGPAEDHAVIELGSILAELAPLRRKYRWSVDAVLVGVLEKSWAEVFGGPEAESSWLVAHDLRPALGVSRGIGNLSAAAGVSIANPTADLVDVIDEVEATIASQSDDLFTAGSAIGTWGSAVVIGLGQMLRLSRRLRAHRTVSNVGQLGDSLDDWGDAHLDRLWFVGPLADPPFTSFIATGHGSSTLISMRVSPGWLTADHAVAIEQAATELI